MLSALKKYFFSSKLASESRVAEVLSTPSIPSLYGLRLGGTVRLDDLFLTLKEKDETLLLEGPAREVSIDAVGLIHLNHTNKIVRFYTSDESFIQINVDGELNEANITETMLFYFSNTQPVSGQENWENALSQVAQNPYLYLDRTYVPLWDTSLDNRPIAIEELVTTQDQKAFESRQFFMAYAYGAIDDDTSPSELLLVSAEETDVAGSIDAFDRCVVTSIGYHIDQTSFTVIS